MFWILVVLSFINQNVFIVYNSALQAILLHDLIKNIIFLNSLSSFWYTGKKYSIYHLSQSWQTLKMKEKITFFFISLGPFAIAERKKTKNVITLRSWEIITIALEVNLRKEAWYFPLFQSHTEVILELQWKQRRLHSASNWYAS